MIEPMLVAVIASTGTFSSCSTLSTPMCAKPRAPPPESTRPMRGARRGGCIPRRQAGDLVRGAGGAAQQCERAAREYPGRPANHRLLRGA